MHRADNKAVHGHFFGLFHPGRWQMEGCLQRVVLMGGARQRVWKGSAGGVFATGLGLNIPTVVSPAAPAPTDRHCNNVSQSATSLRQEVSLSAESHPPQALGN